MAAASLSSRFLELAREAGAVEAQGGQSGTEVESGVLYAQPIRLQVAHGGPPLQLAEYQGVVGLMERRLQTFRPFDHGGDILGVVAEVHDQKCVGFSATIANHSRITIAEVKTATCLPPLSRCRRCAQFPEAECELAHDGRAKAARKAPREQVGGHSRRKHSGQWSFSVRESRRTHATASSRWRRSPAVVSMWTRTGTARKMR